MKPQATLDEIIDLMMRTPHAEGARQDGGWLGYSGAYHSVRIKVVKEPGKPGYTIRLSYRVMGVDAKGEPSSEPELMQEAYSSVNRTEAKLIADKVSLLSGVTLSFSPPVVKEDVDPLKAIAAKIMEKANARVKEEASEEV